MPFPDSARYAKAAAEAIGARFEDLDDGNGYLFRISKGGRFVLAGGGNVCAYPVNSATAFGVSRDKAHTKAVLASVNLPVIPGSLFFAHGRRAPLRAPGREAADAPAFAARLGYPVFCKPNSGSRGNFAEVIADEPALIDYIRRVAEDFETFLIEPVLAGAEHRVLVFDGRPIFHSTKAEPKLTGDGVSTLANLLQAMNDHIHKAGVSAYPLSAITSAGRRPADVLAPGEQLTVHGRRNLTAAGGIEQISTDVPAHLADLARDGAAALGLRLAAIDIFDLSASGDLSDLVIIEINGNPGLKGLEIAGRMDLIRALWTAMLQDALGGTP